MLRYKPKNKISFLGDILIIIVLLIFAFIIYNGFVNEEINKINSANTKHLVYNQKLIPDDKVDYLEELKSIDNKYTETIISFIELQEDTHKFSRKIEYDIAIEKCVKEKRITELNIIKNRKQKILNNFEDLKNNKVEIIYWSSYINVLKNYDLDQIKIYLQSNVC